MKHLQHILLLNLAMLCISTSGPIGRFIAMPPPVTIWFRASFAMLIIGAFCRFRAFHFKVETKEDKQLLFWSGLLMAGHWVTYFYALQWANVAIAMLTLFSYPILTTFLEPLFFKTKIKSSHLFLGLLILIGIFFLAPSFDFKDDIFLGLLMGLASALLYALRNLLLKKAVGRFNGSVLMFYQMLMTTLILIPVLFLFEIDLNIVASHLPYILFLGIVTTAIGHTLFLNSLKYFEVSTASIMSSVQPIYGILLAMLFLGEFPEGRSVIGGILILSTVILESIWSAKKR